MSRYERTYEAVGESDELDREAAIERAYALGVAAAVGDPPPEELAALTDAVGSAYDRNVVELAYEEGRTEALAAADEQTDDGQVWAELVGGGSEAASGETSEMSERSGMLDALDRPDALGRIEALDRIDLDSTEATELPEFLDRE